MPMSYQVRYTSRAAEQKETLPPEGQRALTGLEKQLGENPWNAGREDKRDGSWRASFGRFGDAQYVIGERDIVRVTMLFITWAG
jgi:mRNA-degrading endonuclease RelE of RelBE toxin-antitoxin system